MALTRDDFYKSKDMEVPLLEVDIPELGDKVYLKEPTAGQVDQLRSTQTKKAQLSVGAATVGFRARFAILVCCDDKRAPLFAATDEGWLCNHPKSNAILDRIFAAGKHFLGFEDDVETEAKNLQTTQGDDSSTD